MNQLKYQNGTVILMNDALHRSKRLHGTVSSMEDEEKQEKQLKMQHG